MIVGVRLNVVVREVACVEGRGTVPLSQVQQDVDFRLQQGTKSFPKRYYRSQSFHVSNEIKTYFYAILTAIVLDAQLIKV